MTVDTRGGVEYRPLRWHAQEKPSFRTIHRRDVVLPRNFAGAKVSRCSNVAVILTKEGHVHAVQPDGGTIRDLWSLKGQGVKLFEVNSEGSLVAVVTSRGELQVWSLYSQVAPISRFTSSLGSILSVQWSPYSHALLLTLSRSTHLMFPLVEPLVVQLPHLRGTGAFLPGTARIVGLCEQRLYDIDLCHTEPMPAEAK